MKLISILLFSFWLVGAGVAHSYDAVNVERDLKAIESIIEDFCQVKKLCENKEHGKFTVYRYDGEETDKILSPSEKETMAPCKKKYEIRMTINNTESVHIYCYDDSKPRLIVEKTITGERK